MQSSTNSIFRSLQKKDLPKKHSFSIESLISMPESERHSSNILSNPTNFSNEPNLVDQIRFEDSSNASVASPNATETINTRTYPPISLSSVPCRRVLMPVVYTSELYNPAFNLSLPSSSSSVQYVQSLLRHQLRKERRKNSCRKPRQAYSNQQLQCLESEFLQDMYLSQVRRIELAERLELTEVQIRTWFQNRRTKLKKQIVAGYLPQNQISSSMSYY